MVIFLLTVVTLLTLQILPTHIGRAAEGAGGARADARGVEVWLGNAVH
jgi:hypothetical protein